MIIYAKGSGSMGEINILQKLERKEKKPEELVDFVVKDPKLFAMVFTGTAKPKANVKYGSTKILRIISEKNPKILYPHMDFFIELMDNENQILKWNALDIIANLLEVDKNKKFEEIFDRYYAFITDEEMITAGHVVDNSGKIALAKPHLRYKITKHLLTVETTPRNQECKNILLGKAILSFHKYFDSAENKNEIISFVKRQLNNSRNATKKKAEKFLKKVEKQNKKH